MTGSVDLGLTVTLKLYYCDDIFETSLILDATAIQRWLADYDPDKYGINEPLH